MAARPEARMRTFVSFTILEIIYCNPLHLASRDYFVRDETLGTVTIERCGKSFKKHVNLLKSVILMLYRSISSFLPSLFSPFFFSMNLYFTSSGESVLYANERPFVPVDFNPML